MSDVSKRIAQLSPAKRALLERRLQDQQRPQPASAAPIAVIGIGCRFPGGGETAGAFWDTLVAGVDAIRVTPPERWDADALYDADATVRGKMATRWGGYLDDVDLFDPAFFDLTDREAVRMDPQQRLFMETAWTALEDAGLVAAGLAGSATGVFVATHNLSSDYYVRQTYERSDIDAYSATGGAHSIVANRLSYWLDLQGPSLTVDTACSGSLVATHLAVNSLRGGECDAAIAGGVNLILEPETTMALSGLQMMASDGRCKSFDARADGFVRGEGCGALVLKRLADAERDGDRIYAVIRGSAINQDGRTNGLTAPNGLSQQRVLRQALRQAGVDGAQIGYVETHGTGTAIGDPIEVEALTEVVGRPADGTPCVLGSVKTNIGHLESAAGIAGLIKAVLCLHREYIPQNLHFTSLNPHISLDGTRFAIPTEGRTWASGAAPRYAGVSSFGFGGTNAHMVLGEAPRGETRQRDADTEREPLLLVSARDRGALEALAADFVNVLTSDGSRYRDICYTAACRRTQHEHRLAVPLSDPAEAATALQAWLEGEAPAGLIEPRGIPDVRRMAWVFSGQGSQHVGMGRRLLATEPVFRDTIERIDEIFSALAGWSLRDELLASDEERLSRTEIAQPAIIAVELGLAAVLEHYGLRPTAVVGHSLGEVAAACVGGALTLEDAITVIFHRGRLMQRLHGAGRMAAVSASEDELRRLLAQGREGISIAAVNGPVSVTISGEPSELDNFLAGLDAPWQLLPVEYAFHSAQTEPLRAELASALDGIRARDPAIAVYSTVHGGPAAHGDFGPAYWAQNIRQPVLFGDAIRSMADAGIGCFVELGPQAVLGPAIEQSIDALGKRAAVHAALLRGRTERLREVLAALHVDGQAIDWNAYYGASGHTVALPTYRWQRRRCWFEPSARRGGGGERRTDVGDWGYEVAWPLRTPLDGWFERPALEDAALLGAASARVEALRESVYEAQGAADSRQRVEALELASARYAWHALRDLGFGLMQDDRYADEDIDGLADGHRRRVIVRLFRLLEKHGVVRRDADHWSVCGEMTDADRDDLSSLRSGGDEIVALLERCGRQVANVVLERVDPLSLLFPGDYRTSAEWVYADASFSRVSNDLVAEAVDAMVESLPGDRNLRILEIGAGTGGTTRRIISKLPAGRTEYVFTDLSRSFLKQADERFARDLPVHSAVLDLERDPAEQGYAEGQFDIVIAANVVHATTDVRQSLRHARRLLTPGGVLLLLEGTARRGWVDLTFGLTEGWWRFEDTDIRTDHPLLDADTWQRVLSDSGFTDVAAVATQRDAAACLFEQHILLARAPVQRTSRNAATAATRDAAAPWIVIGSGDECATALQDELAGDGTPCVVAELTDGDASFAQEPFRINATRKGDLAELLRRADPDGDTGIGAIVHLGAVQDSVEDGIEIDWDTRLGRSCGAALHLLQALSESGTQPKHGVWLATRGAQPVPAGGSAPSVAQAPLWGFGRVAAREQPELWGGLIDLDPAGDAESNAAALRRVVTSGRDENQVAIRAGDRYVARLVESPLAGSQGPALKEDCSYLIVGGLGGIGLQVARWMVRHGARHLTMTSRRGAAAASAAPVAEVLRELESAGAQVTVEAIDGADRTAMADLIASYGRARPRLAGVIHTAAVIDFKPLVDLSLEEFLGALRVKVAGAWILHELTADLPLDFLLLFSSMASLGGFPQLGPYAAGNAFMDALAHRRRESGLPGQSINWGLWSEGRATSDENKRLFERVGLLAMPSDLALQGLERAMATGSAQKTVAWVDWSTFRPVYDSRGARGFLSRLSHRVEASLDDAPAAPTGVRSALRGRLEAAEPAAALHLLETTVCEEVAAILGVGSSEVSGRSEGFFHMGMDSIMTVELRRRLEAKLGAALPTTLAFEYPTIERLAAYLADEVLGHGRVGDTGSRGAPPEPPADDDDDLDAYSDAELAAELDRELARLGNTGGSGAN